MTFVFSGVVISKTQPAKPTLPKRIFLKILALPFHTWNQNTSDPTIFGITATLTSRGGKKETCPNHLWIYGDKNSFKICSKIWTNTKPHLHLRHLLDIRWNRPSKRHRENETPSRTQNRSVNGYQFCRYPGDFLICWISVKMTDD